MDYTRNPFIIGLWAPIYLFAGALAVTNDFLMAALYIMGTLGLIGAYVTEFPILSTLYQNEVVHKVAISSLLGMLLGMIIGLSFAGGDASESSPISMQAKLMLVWGVMSLPAYPMMVFLVSRVNKRDLEAEQAVRDEKKKNRKGGGGPPILNKDGGGL